MFLSNAGEPFSLDYLTRTGARLRGSRAKIGKQGACHMFRHTMATLMLEGGADIRFIQAMLGHADLKTTQIYTHVAIRQLQEIHRRRIRRNWSARSGIFRKRLRRKATTMASDALERLIDIAHGNTGQSGKVANFLLAWWNAEECGGFDLTDLWGVDASIAADIVAVFALMAECREYPDTLGYGKQFEAIVRAWRPGLRS